MNNVRNNAVHDFVNNVKLLSNLKYYYEILNDVISIDVKSFNSNFLNIINTKIKSNNITKFILDIESKEKKERNIEFGLFFKEVSKYNINLNNYIIAIRNLIFNNFFDIFNVSKKSLQLKRMNYDDIEVISTNNSINKSNFVNYKYLDITKIVKYDYVIVLNKRDGIYYIKDNKILNIKYTSAWVNIPAYYDIVSYVINFLIGNIKTIKDLNERLYNYIEYADNSNFFKYEYDELSSKFEPSDLITADVKYLFIANVMTKFLPLINNDYISQQCVLDY